MLGTQFLPSVDAPCLGAGSLANGSVPVEPVELGPIALARRPQVRWILVTMLLPTRVLRPSRPVDLSAVGTSWGNIVDCQHISRHFRSLDSCNSAASNQVMQCNWGHSLLPVRFVVHRLTKGLDCNAELIDVDTPH